METTTILRGLAVLLLGLAGACAAAAPREPNVVVVTLDGVRVQEIFGGMDVDIARAAGDEGGDAGQFDRYRGDSAVQRRERLMPFFWGTLMREHGWIAGNAALGSRVQLGNRMRFSYPGYAELLTGVPRDDSVTSNAAIQSPHPTVLEFVREQLRLPRAKVAAFGSWDRFAGIPEHTPGSITVNAGFMPFVDSDPGIQRLDAIQTQARTWRHERFDAFTAAFALRYLERERPRLLYVGLGDTDEWAHAGRYIDTLEGLALADRFLQALWQWLQSQPDYRDNTVLVIATDHGRGRSVRDWSDHGPQVEGAQDVWLAMAGPGQARRGELRQAPELRQGQIAASIAALFGLDFRRLEPEAGEPVQETLRRP
ncbi:alkaline phosphatase family protein [Stenotrophomonas acidaminiphila]